MSFSFRALLSRVLQSLLNLRSSPFFLFSSLIGLGQFHTPTTQSVPQSQSSHDKDEYKWKEGCQGGREPGCGTSNGGLGKAGCTYLLWEGRNNVWFCLGRKFSLLHQHTSVTCLSEGDNLLWVNWMTYDSYKLYQEITDQNVANKRFILQLSVEDSVALQLLYVSSGVSPSNTLKPVRQDSDSRVDPTVNRKPLFLTTLCVNLWKKHAISVYFIVHTFVILSVNVR